MRWLELTVTCDNEAIEAVSEILGRIGSGSAVRPTRLIRDHADELSAREDPTAGVDVGTKAEIYRLLADAVGRGQAVLLIATDFEEVAEICHRALVFRGGRIVAELAGDRLSHEQLVHTASLAGDAYRDRADVH